MSQITPSPSVLELTPTPGESVSDEVKDILDSVSDSRIPKYFDRYSREFKEEFIIQAIQQNRVVLAKDLLFKFKDKNEFLANLINHDPKTYVILTEEKGSTIFPSGQYLKQVIPTSKSETFKTLYTSRKEHCTLIDQVLQSICDEPFTQDLYHKFNNLRSPFLAHYMRNSGNCFGGVLQIRTDADSKVSTLSEYNNECLSKKVPQIGFIIITSEFVVTESHANAVIVNLDKKKIEYFEPHGVDTEAKKAQEHAKRRLLKIKEFSGFYFSGVEETCPYFGPQAMTGDSMCAHWSLLFLVLRLACPSIDTNQMLEAIVDQGKDSLVNLMKHFHCFLWNYVKTNKIDVAYTISLKIKLNGEIRAMDAAQEALQEFETGNVKAILDFAETVTLPENTTKFTLFKSGNEGAS